MTASALAAEEQAARFTDGGARGVTLRFGQFVAPDSGHLQDLLPILERGWLPLVGDHDGYATYLDADDAAAAVVAALDAPAGLYNVVDDEPLTRAEHAAVVSDAFGHAVRLPPAVVGPLPRLRLQARSQRVSNARFREVTSWAPRCASMRQGWPAVLAALREEDDRAA
jgi:nucleoside-diphosphate-sugar epimerase